MNATQVIVLLAVVAILAASVILFFGRDRRRKLKARFGPEYNRTVSEIGSKLKAEAELRKLQQRVEKYPIRTLSSADRSRYQQSWRAIQASFVDAPDRAFADADQLLTEVMSARGYPVADFDRRAAELSVDHAPVIEPYRVAHEIELRRLQGRATTEDLRKGMIHYRTLFDELMGEQEQLHVGAAGLSS